MLACSFPFVFLLFTSLQSFSGGTSPNPLISEPPVNSSVSAGAAGALSPDTSGWTSAGEVEFSTVVQGWSAIPWSFSKCRSTFEQRPPASEAIQAVAALASSTELVVSKYSSCKGCRSLGVQSSYYLEFEQIIRQIFLSWQSVLLDGSQKYGQQWKSSIGLGFGAFSPFLNTAYNMCTSLQIDLTKLFQSMNINYQLFLDVKIDLVARLKLNVDITKTGLLPQGSVQSSASRGNLPETNLTAPHASPEASTPVNTTAPSGLASSAGQGEFAIVAAWKTVPTAFGKLLAIFHQHATVPTALQAVGRLQVTIQSVLSRYGNCDSCAATNHPDLLRTQFELQISAIFLAWQKVLSVGQQQYRAEWSVSFKAAFAKFDQLLVSIHGIAAAIRLDLNALLVKLHLNFELFLSVGLDVSLRLDILNRGVAGQLGGVVTPVDGAVNSLVAPGSPDNGTSSPEEVKPSPSGDSPASGVATSPTSRTPTAPGFNSSIPDCSGNNSAPGDAPPPITSGGAIPSPDIGQPAAGPANFSGNHLAPGAGGNYSAPEDAPPPITSGGAIPSPDIGQAASGPANFSGNHVAPGVGGNYLAPENIPPPITSGGALPRPDGGEPVAGAAANNCSEPAYGTATSPTAHQPTAPVGPGTPAPEAGTPGAAVPTNSSYYPAPGAVNYSTPVTGSIPSYDGGNPVAGALATNDSDLPHGTVTSPTEHELSASGVNASIPAEVQPAVGAAGLLSNTANPSFAHSSSVPAQELPGQDMSALVAGWSPLPSAFTKAQLTLESRPSIEISIQAIVSLQATVQATISVHGSCSSCNGLSSNSALSIQFKAILTQIFTSWQKIITIGQANYGVQWRTSTSVLFQKFSTFLVSVKVIASASHIDLGSLFGAIHLEGHLFAGFGVNLPGLASFNQDGRISAPFDLHNITSWFLS